MKTNSTAPENSGDQSPDHKRTSRRALVGVLAGVVATVGLGLAVQSPISTAKASEAPMGAQLPWDDTPSDGAAADEAGQDGWSNPPADRSMRGGRHEGRHMHGEGRPGGPQGGSDRGDRLGGPRELLAVAAEKLGMSPEDLVAELKAGKSVADVAAERNVPVQDVIDALVDKVMENATERMTDLVNRKPPMRTNGTPDTPGSDTPES